MKTALALNIFLVFFCLAMALTCAYRSSIEGVGGWIAATIVAMSRVADSVVDMMDKKKNKRNKAQLIKY